ncbi:tetratricopeptide repeat protein [Streptomyces sp. NPDC057680]|uniref:tetratricopeptide repeat protein n=1 Tax=Streptomyces sp. NPDC057680 TaxID=3346208 RepID=UPI00368A4AEC
MDRRRRGSNRPTEASGGRRRTLTRLLAAPAAAAVTGAIVWAVARFGLEAADQTASVVGGTVAALSLPISLLALRERPAGPDAPAGAAGSPPGAGNGGGREWVPAAAVHPSLRPPASPLPFRGRADELVVLDELLRGAGGLAVICGTGGLGKTTLAAEHARRARQDGTDVFWVRWQDDLTRLADDLTRIAQALGLDDGSLHEAQRGEAVLVDVVWEQLAARRNWLIIIDNVDTPARLSTDADPLASYRGWVRAEGAGLLLLTSRDSAGSVWGPRAVLVRPDPLGGDDAAAVLCDAARDAGSHAEARELAERLGGLPLALEAAGRYLATATSRYRTFSAYRHALEAEFDGLVAAADPRAADPEVARTLVRHTWDVSLDQLHSDGHTLSRPLLRLLALLEAAPVPRSLITPGLLGRVTGEAVSPAALDAAFAGLDRYGLVGTPHTQALRSGAEQQEEDGIVQVVLHPVVRDVMALHVPGAEPAAWCAALDAGLTAAVDDAVAAGAAGRPVARLLAPHLPALLERAPAAAFPAARDSVSRLLNVLEADRRGDLPTFILRRHLSEAEARVLGADHPDTLTSRHLLAGDLYRLGRLHDSCDASREVAAARARVLGGDHPDTLESRHDYAVVLDVLEHQQEAVGLFREIARDRERVLGADHPSTLTTRGSLALALDDLGLHQEAVDLLRGVVADRERLLGTDHPATLFGRQKLAIPLGSLGEHQEAADLLRGVVASHERLHGPDHPSVLSSRLALAAPLSHLALHEEAALVLRDVIARSERVLGPDHLHTVTSRFNLGLALMRLGEPREAAGLFRSVADDYTRVYGSGHGRTRDAHERAVAAEAESRRRRRWRRG